MKRFPLITLPLVLLASSVWSAQTAIVALTWRPGDTSADPSQFWVHVLDPTAQDDAELGTLLLNEPPERRIWCSRLHRGDPPGVYLNWVDDAPGLSVRPVLWGGSLRKWCGSWA